jgi:type I restriction enzyme S subunit
VSTKPGQLHCVGDGPDLCLEHGNVKVWIEAVCPEPKNLPADWLKWPKPGEVKVGMFPHEQILLRWTTAFDAKVSKLKTYLKKGTVLPTDAYIIAINGCQLGLTPGARGITQMPFGVETVFPIGPLQVSINRETKKIEGSSISLRFSIVNHNNAAIPTTPFVDPAYSGVSAVFGCATDRRYGKPLAMHVVHNPLATVPVSRGLFGVDEEEWFAVPVTGSPDEFYLTHV